MNKVFLSDMDSWNKVLEEESFKWVRNLIISYGLSETKVFSNDSGSAVEYLVQNKEYVENVENHFLQINQVGNAESVIISMQKEKHKN